MNMKKVFTVIAVMVACLLIASFALAAGNADKGKAAFNDAKFAGGKKACGSCHPNGKGLEQSGAKKEFTIMGKKAASLEDAINICIEGANGGKAIKKDSAEMADMSAYIKSLAAAKPAAAAPAAPAPAKPAAAAPAAPAPAKKSSGGY